MPRRILSSSNSLTYDSLEEWTCSASVMNFIWSLQRRRAMAKIFSYSPQVVAVDDQQLVLVELHFLRDAGVEHGDAGAAVVHQQVFVVVQDALEHRQVDVLAVQVDVAAVLRGCGWFRAPRRPRSPADRAMSMNVSNSCSLEAAAISTGTFDFDLLVAVDVVAVALAGHDLQVVRRADGVGQHEVAVARRRPGALRAPLR